MAEKYEKLARFCRWFALAMLVLAFVAFLASAVLNLLGAR